MKKISIIVPIYNVKNYVEKCVKSIISQTYTNIEIILVDDGATDGSEAICDELAKEDSRIVVIHKQNGGLSDARNAGIDIATGDYIGFVDGDDTVEVDMFEKLVNNLEKYGADISGCRYRRVWENGDHEEIGNDNEVNVYNGSEGLREYLFAKTVDPFVCNKIFTKEILEQTRFIKGIIGEDNPFCIEIFKRAKVIVQSDAPDYNYLQKRAGAITNSSMSQKKIDSIFRWNDIRLECKAFDPSLEKYALRRQMLFYVGLYNEICKDKKYKEVADDIRKFVKEHCSEIQKSDICERTVKMSVLLLSKCPAVYRTVMKAYKKTVGEAKL